MKRFPILAFALFAFLFSCSTKDERKQIESENNNAELELLANGKLRFLKLNGTAYEKGLAHGRLLKSDIQEVIQLFKEDIKSSTGQDPDDFIKSFLSQTDYKYSVEKWTPELMEELKGISEGSGVDFETIFMHQLGDEYWFNTKDILAHSCSSFGVNKTSSEPSIAAQNMDIPEFYHGFQTVIESSSPDSDKKLMYLTIPGHLGITGMNDRSLSINCNTLMQLDYGKTGLPVTFIVRGVLSKETQEEALAFLDEINHASGQNYIIGGPEKVVSMECSSHKIVEFRPFENSLFTYHTNHPMSNTDYSANYLEALKANNKSPEEGLYECQRIKSFQRRFTENTKSISLDEIKNVLSSRDNEGSDVVSNRTTYSSVIYELSENPKFIIAPGKPHETEYIELEW
ncbi:C45 family peptidase [Algoriphagus sp.]|uniref:C45 family autoproteolytic acyltransferase/hydolase n=1 Tax=Algoriphagus sp. TaxID=1872435 RepID=UPI0025E547BA|nr:C45 family peptidase [Algoriphagus sp.]